MDRTQPLAIRAAVTADEVADPTALAGGPVDVVGVPVWKEPDGPVVADGVPRLGTFPTELDGPRARRWGFEGKVGEVLSTTDAAGGLSVVYVGCGSRGEASLDAFRRAAAALVRGAGTSGTALFVVPAGLGGTHDVHDVARAVAEGAALASYRFTAHRNDEARDARIGTLVVVASSPGSTGTTEGSWADALRRGRRVAEAVFLARDLVNEPPSSLTPRKMAEVAAEWVASQPGVSVEVWDEDRIAEERMGGLLGVARGSAEPPRLLRLDYEPAEPVEVDGKVPHVVLVGKGITFDSGGLSLKTAAGMTTMKTDMSGSAAVLAALSACGDLGVRVRVTAIAPMTENMPGGRAQKPGDVLTIRDGQTIEVLNTDAEGRLVLADALVLAAELQPDLIVDLATLTGACVVALGPTISGLFGNDDDAIARVREASELAGEPAWPLPLPDEYRSHIDSEIADMKNVGKNGQAGAIAAALLLARFVGETPWVHLDIAGPARSEEDKGLMAKGGTGVGVRTLLRLLDGYA